ncbi:CBO0543 family protein [Sporomusa sp.]|uniref:CBO0543 family protein n=1 Tax=Sporomusa sp. TaxID=2078658 RepID=UPI002CA79FEB|nr:CBO0543 family protein [Sporomusa sp.]HWR09058.1 CBO0543 family protein [Sporomusa sp.]
MFFSDSGVSTTVELQKALTDLRINEWLHEDIFHFKWYFLIGLFVLSLFAWCKLVDKKRLPEITLHAGLTMFITLVLDEFGEELTLWDYPVDIIPIFPPLTAVDLVCLPMIYSLIYQHFKTWQSFLRATIIMAGIFCFVFEPILVWGGFYEIIKWKYYYGFPIYIMMAIFIRWTVIKIYTIAENAKAKKKFASR